MEEPALFVSACSKYTLLHSRNNGLETFCVQSERVISDDVIYCVQSIVCNHKLISQYKIMKPGNER